MVKTQAFKKRKGSDYSGDAGVATVKAEDDADAAAAPVLVAPPDHSSLSPIEKILGVDLWKDDSNTVQSALTQLAEMCFDNNEEENRATVHRLGGAAILPGVLRKWYGFPGIQAEGCRALQNASYSIAAFGKSVKDSGGLNAIIWAMKSYPNNPEVQISGCGVLGNMVDGVQESAEYVVKTLNGIDWIVAAMNKFPEDAELQRCACGALDNLVKWEEFHDTVKQAGGRRALVDAIENHEDVSKQHVEKLQHFAKHALKKLLR